MALRETTKTLLALALASTALLVAPQATAEEWSRSGPNGSTTRSVNTGSGSYSVERSGTNGGTSSATVDCHANAGIQCSRDYTGTNSAGETVSGTRQSRFGPLRGRSVNTVTGPSDKTFVTRQPTRRYNRVDPGFRGRRPGPG
ncbi:MAG: hypothetical protein AAFQ88_03185 [Pseudomonadota bacterium]